MTRDRLFLLKPDLWTLLTRASDSIAGTAPSLKVCFHASLHCNQKSMWSE